MTRWHMPSCEAPDVEVGSNNLPQCKACGRSCPPVERLIAERADTSSAPKIPPDQPFGEMSLWWPRCVPYERGGVQAKDSHRPSNEQDAPPDTVPDSPDSHIYREILRSDNFRLASLAAVADQEAPIHVTLEVFLDDDHPEYECASYTWGGEDGDSTPCRPIYIGPYWDVLLQTKNCSSLLRFLRPWRGVRMVWVDAICINQASLPERAVQVAKMKSLYNLCFRVIVYLGDDVVTCSKQFPSSQSLGALNHEQSPFPPPHPLRQYRFGLKELLSRKYFSRLWVIQELVASQQVVIRVGDVNFNADASIIARRFSVDNNDFDPAPWIQYLGAGSISDEHIHGALPGDASSVPVEHATNKSGESLATVHSNDPANRRPQFPDLSLDVTGIDAMLHLLKLSAQSQASDLRDRLFGIISLLPDLDAQRDLAPDYSISYQQLRIGFFAYLLFKGGRYWFLWNAGTMEEAHTTHDSSTPSWMPHCMTNESWREVLENAPRDPTKLPLESQPLLNGAAAPRLREFGAHISPFYRRGDFWGICLLPDTDQSTKHPDDAIDVSTGSLIVNVTHLFALQGGIRVRAKRGPVHVYSLTRKRSPIVLLSIGKLDIQPKKDHVFIMNKLTDTYLILRRLPRRTHGHSCFQLVTSRIRILDLYESDRPDYTELLTHDFNNSESWSRFWPLSQFIPIADIRTSVDTTIIALREELHHWVDDKYGDCRSRHIEGRHTKHYADWTQDFCYFFFRRPCPDLSSSQATAQFFDNIIRLWDALRQKALVEDADRDLRYDDIVGDPVEVIHETIRKCINPRFQAKVVLGNVRREVVLCNLIELKVPHDEWSNFHEQIFHAIRKAENKEEDEETATTLLWRWSYEGETRTHGYAELPGSMLRRLLRKQPEHLIISFELNSFITFAGLHVGRMPRVLHQLIHAYEPPLKVPEIVKMVMEGPTKEQEHTGIPKYLGDIRIDGSQYKIRIV